MLSRPNAAGARAARLTRLAGRASGQRQGPAARIAGPRRRPAGCDRQTRRMSDGMNSESEQQPQIVVVGPGLAADGGDEAEGPAERERPVTEMVEQPAKVMRIGS